MFIKGLIDLMITCISYLLSLLKPDLYLTVTVKNNVGLPSEIIVECLQNCDAENIAPENVKRLLDLLPTEDEVRMIT